MQALRTAATGMAAQQLNVEVISNNIANMNTVGFKKQRAEFQDLLYQTIVQAGAQSSDQGTIVPTGVQIGAGVKAGSVYRVETQGTLTATGNKLDLALSGRGWFQIMGPEGDMLYTRAGAFNTSATGQLVTLNGYQTITSIVVPTGALDVTVSESGIVSARIAGQTAPQQLGQLTLANFANEVGLEPLGGNLYRNTPASGEAVVGVPGDAGYGTLKQGYLESSNVDPVKEISDLISAQRAYEMNSKVIQAADEMAGTVSKGIR